MKSSSLLLTMAIGAAAIAAPLRAEFLFDSYLIPSFEGQPNTEYSRWNIFYNANQGANMPDAAAPNGVYGSASAAGFTPPAGSTPVNPLAFWSNENPTITQTVPGAAFIIGAGTTGNIYSFSVATRFTLTDTTPYTLGTVVFQFQTEGSMVDWDSILLVYNDGSGQQSLSAAEYIREYRSGTSSFGGTGSRAALQWDLTGFGITDYQIIWAAEDTHMSFQQALLDTSATYQPVVPASRTWTGTGAQNWNVGSNWLQGSTSVENGNVRFQNAEVATIHLNTNRTVAEMVFQTASDVTVNGASILTANTGITTTEGAVGTYAINANYRMGAFNIMDIVAGELQLNGVVSGDYGMIKTGSGTLVLGNNNSFGASGGGLGVQGGTVRLGGTNSYRGGSTVLWGKLEVAANAFSGMAGALGNATSAVLVGANSDTFAEIGVLEPAQLVIVGDHSIGRNVNIEMGSFDKRLGARDTTSGAVFSGNMSLLGTGAAATNLSLFAQRAEDTVRFSGNITGGALSRTITINANSQQGTVIFSGSNKTYANSTVVVGGTLVVASGTAVTGNGNWSVASGAALQVDGSIGGAGTFMFAANATLTGSGSLEKVFSVGVGAILSPGNGVGTLTTLSQSWSAGGVYLWEISDSGLSWDRMSIQGSLSVAASPADPFVIRLASLALDGTNGIVHNFDEFTDYSWSIASATLGIDGFSADLFALDTAGFQNTPGGTFEISQLGNELVLTYQAIPEPSTWVLLTLLAIGFAYEARRRCSSGKAPA